MCLPLKTRSSFPLYLGFLSFLTLGDYSTFRNLAPDSEVSSSHHLINMKFYRRLQSKITCLLIVSNGLFNRTMPRQSEAEQSPVILTCTILPGSHLKAYRLLTIKLDPIERRNLGHRG